jgi:hypothetical protein
VTTGESARKAATGAHRLVDIAGDMSIIVTYLHVNWSRIPLPNNRLMTDSDKLVLG